MINRIVPFNISEECARGNSSKKDLRALKYTFASRLEYCGLFFPYPEHIPNILFEPRRSGKLLKNTTEITAWQHLYIVCLIQPPEVCIGLVAKRANFSPKQVQKLQLGWLLHQRTITELIAWKMYLVLANFTVPSVVSCGLHPQHANTYPTSEPSQFPVGPLPSHPQFYPRCPLGAFCVTIVLAVVFAVFLFW